MNSENICLFDLDGTLADFDAAMWTELNKITSPYEDIKTPWDRSKPWLNARRKLIMRQPGYWRNLQKFQLGFNVLDIALTLGFENHVLTKGPSASSIAWGEKVEWCKNHLPKEVKITMTEDKGLVYGKVLVDDWPEYVERWLEWRPRGLVIMPAHEHNEGFNHPNVIRYDGSNLVEVQQAMTYSFSRKAGED